MLGIRLSIRSKLITSLVLPGDKRSHWFQPLIDYHASVHLAGEANSRYVPTVGA
jgi:hypothetical protein